MRDDEKIWGDLAASDAARRWIEPHDAQARHADVGRWEYAQEYRFYVAAKEILGRDVTQQQLRDLWELFDIVGRQATGERQLRAQDL
jgi:hypothetical protein